MITRISVSLIALGVLSLAGCSSVENVATAPSIDVTAAVPEPTPAAEETPVASTQPIPSSEESQPAPVAPTAVPQEAAQPAPEPANPPADTTRFGPTVKNARGNLVKGIGQLAGYDQTASGNMTVEFRVTAIEPNYQCTSGFAAAPLNGNYIAVSIEIETLPSLATAPVPTFHLSQYNMAIISPNGILENDSIGNAYFCSQDSETLPFEIGPSQKAYGTIVLDSAHTSGSLVISLPGGASWEWTF
ncbi:hypothetical protein [Flaviflexus huanghaiensis]|uniref:hypothetical protein n=1 Tax=Flaviflexus huanghaiensis TaxID=1111473 RepID=UPI0015FA1544|nr:hypothetical protein [Flaviflexus huanghaiensis]